MEGDYTSNPPVRARPRGARVGGCASGTEKHPVPARAEPAILPPVDYGTWNPVTKRSAPQGASYRSIHIAHARLPLRLTGVFQSHSPYFRFGFKLMGVRGHPFSPGSIQTEDKNIL